MDKAEPEVNKINKLMIFFAGIMEEMNEKKQLLIDAYPDRAREVMRRLALTPHVGASHLIVQRSSYNVIQNRRIVEDKGKQIVESTSLVLEERPLEPSPKRRKLIREEESHGQEYSPIQSPLRIEGEQLTGEQVEQIGSKGGVFITQAEIDEGTL